MDHFDITDDRTWKQRFWANTSYLDRARSFSSSADASSLPVFLMIGGEGEENPVWLGQGAWQDYAREIGGAIFFLLEHRFANRTITVI